MSPVHVIVGEDERAEAMWAAAFTGAVDLYRFDRNWDNAATNNERVVALGFDGASLIAAGTWANPVASKLIRPMSKSRSKAGVRRSPLYLSSRSLLSHRRQGLM